MARTQGNRGEAPAHIVGPRILMLLSVLALLLIGFVMIYSTSSIIALSTAESVAEADPMGDVLKQMLFAVIGIGLALVLWKVIPVHFWRGGAVWFVCAASFALLLATSFSGAGGDDWGAQRWLVLGPFSLQPSEFAKIALVLVSARLLTDFREGAYTFRVFIALVFVCVLMPVLMILGLQSDLGTAMICVVGILAVMWLGEVPLKVMGIAVALVGLVGLVGILLKPYRLARLMVFLNPWSDSQDTGYQLIHSLYALASGGLFGVGVGNSHEKYLYLTQSDTDFIFAIIGEELGLVGALAVIGLFLLFLYAGMRIARSASDNYGAMVAGGCTIMIAFQAFLNIAMVIGWFPVVGKPLPFVSSGGSALLAMLIMVGLILSVSQDASAPTIYDRRWADLRVVRASEGGLSGREDAGRASRSRTRR